MGLLSKFKSSPGAAAEPRASGATTDANEIVRDARTRARRRLIGAAILLGVGIIGFPLLFETQPRPIAVDIPIEVPSRDTVAPLQAPARPARLAAAEPVRPPVEPPGTEAAAVATEPSPATARPMPEAEPKPELPLAAQPAAKPNEAPKPAAKPGDKLVDKPADKPVDKPAEKTADKPAATDDGRFVVQVGAFSEAASAREARMKVEAMGLKTYTQVIESDSGRRIRVRLGPYGTKAEADKAAARVKAGGLQAAVLKL